MTTISVQAQDEDVMLQGFDWNIFSNLPNGTSWFDIINQNSQVINSAGFDMLWLPPCSDSAAPQGYLPRELYNFNSAYGSEADLRSLIDQMHQLNIKVIGDIVINHRVGTADAVTFTNPNWPTFFITADDEGRDFVDGPVDFSINGDYFPGALKSDGSNGTYGPARDLDHFNPAVRQEIINWMNVLKNDLGYDGWRYDFVHGYDPIFNKQYNDATQPYFAVGELLESGRFQTELWVDLTQNSSSAFDFNTKVSLQNAIRFNNFSFLRDGNGNPSGMIGNKPNKSVTFLENHDTGAAQQCCGADYIFPGGEVNLRKGYAYILTHPGVPMVFWPHYFDNGSGVQNAINELITIRKDVRIHSGTTMNIVESRNDLYAAYIDGRNGTIAMKLGQGDWSPNGDNWNLRTSGVDYAVWTQGGTTTERTDFAVFAKNFTTTYTWQNNQATSGQWPGINMESIGNNWYKAMVPGDCTNIIFSNNGNGQTADLNACNTAPYYVNGQFFASPPSDFPANARSFDTNKVTTPLVIYPNPFTKTFEVRSDDVLKSDASFKVFTISGQLIYHKIIEKEQQNSFSVSLEENTVGKGVYFYRFTDESGILSTGKLIKN
ncbi:hypothetical protein GCM10022393_41560 [Aquimarina addita]|uniref:Alpha-amylase n=2 Tax=Aquimarina addita TaxID=870485 RepID=A0ABP6UVU0_9FLAO